jgi:hypothetical protein
MTKERKLLLGSRTASLSFLCLSLLVGLLACVQPTAQAPREDSQSSQYVEQYVEENNQIRRERFDLILPQIMRGRDIDMWIHVMREAIPDSFGAEDLGSTSGVFIFTDRGGDRIERAILGRRWGSTQRERGNSDYELIDEMGAYDIIGDPVFVQEPVSSPMTEYDHRFTGLREFVAARDPQTIALNYQSELGPWPTTRARDGISHTDYLLLTEEIGDTYASRLVSSEYLVMDYNISPVPTEVELLKGMRKEEVERVNKAFAEVEVGEHTEEVDVTIFRRMWTGESQRGRSAGWENSVVQGGDILAAPSQGMYAYVLRDGETEPPAEIKKIWAEYLKVKAIFIETIKSGLTPRQIIQDYKRRFNEEEIIVVEPQMHMVQPKNNFPFYSEGYDPDKTLISVDLHGKGKGSRERKFDIYLGPRMGSYGPDWTFDVPLQPNHHFVLEYFFYMPSPAGEGQDQYLLWWDHEQAIATESGVELLVPLQTELYLIH